MSNIIENYNKALQDIYDHVGFKEDWVVYPIDTSTIEMYWDIEWDKVMFAESKEEFLEMEYNYYEDELYKQRFYEKHVYEGSEYTLVFCDPHTDDMKWFRIFKNDLRFKDYDKDER